MNNKALYDRSTDSLELEVNVPRTIGILRDGSDFKTAIQKRQNWTNVSVALLWIPASLSLATHEG